MIVDNEIACVNDSLIFRRLSLTDCHQTFSNKVFLHLICFIKECLVATQECMTLTTVATVMMMRMMTMMMNRSMKFFKEWHRVIGKSQSPKNPLKKVFEIPALL